MAKLPELLWLPAAALSVNVYATDYLTVDQAQQVLFAQADEFVAVNITLSEPQLDAIKEQAGVRQRTDKPEIYRASQQGQVLGFVFVDNVVGKHEFISYALATDLTGKVLGMEILSYRETHGGQVRNPDWRVNFLGKQLGQPFKLNKDIPNISGATLSCRNITDGVKRLLTLQQLVLSAQPA